jgi:16S rRNA (cytosine1402-N4)-methyltransferase
MTAASPDHPRHIPVLLSDVLEQLQPTAGETYIDGTFGAGGYSRAILEAADCRLIAIERDPTAFANGQALAAEFGGRLTLVPTTFSEMEQAAADFGLTAVDGIVLDIGVSSMQLDEPERGFSFLRDGPLDMRMSQSGASAADVVNTAGEEDLANILYDLGEERRSRAIARAIVKARADAPILTTKQLADLTERVLGRARGDEKHPRSKRGNAF